MKLGVKVIVSQIGIGLLTALVIFGLVEMVWVKNYEMLEQKSVQDNLRRTEFIWTKEQDTLKSIVADWAPWDELYEFAKNPKVKDFAEKNLQESAMANLRITAAVVTDPAGRIIYSKAIDLGQRKEMTVPSELVRHIRPGQYFLDALEGEKSATGVLWMNNQPVMMAAQRIYKSDKSGPGLGLLIFLRIVDAEVLDEISNIVQAPVKLASSEEYLAQGPANLGAEQSNPDDKLIRAYLPVKDMYGNIVCALSVDNERKIYQEMQKQVRTFIALILGMVFVIASLSIVGLNLLVLRRLEKMDSFLKQADIIDGEPKQLEVDGNDELTQLTASMNGMLVRIAQSKKEINELNVSLQKELVERKRVEIILEYTSQHDSLTGLYNRAYLDSIHRGIFEKGANEVGVICCDLDGLKLVNDTLGHAAGDSLLKRTATLLNSVVPETAVTVRTGGDEFLILIIGVSEAELDFLGHRIRENIGNMDPNEIPLQISMGWRHRKICIPESTDMERLIKEADDEMYRQKLSSAQSTRSSVVHTIMKMLEIRDFATEEHSQRLSKMALDLSERIVLAEHRKNDLHLLAQFHDIGKIGISDQILLKPGALTVGERKEIERHSEIGHRIAMVIPELQPVADLILKHHERWDGNGYPLGLKGEEIPLENRILSIVDAFDAMTSDRPYRKAMSTSDACEELRKFSGTQFDAVLAEHFLAMILEENIEG